MCKRKKIPVNLELRDRILNIIEEQISGNNPPEVKITYERLLKEGFDEVPSKQLIGQCVVLELFDMIKSNSSFNLDRYIDNLNMLPKNPKE